MKKKKKKNYFQMSDEEFEKFVQRRGKICDEGFGLDRNYYLAAVIWWTGPLAVITVFIIYLITKG